MNKVNASHILVKTKEEAELCLNLLKVGKNFEELAGEKSLCPSKKRGGSLGWFGRGKMVREFEQACFSGKKGVIVGPIKTQFGCHIIKINDTE
ncbi:peptidylprolyl isomerase [Candidatus Pacearchaeota archaeon RBG_13_36_9]|nr:MAG: peptidylprolyl isomerase [Candidatus Pacearchaeota archaeon RBG_13_36_9]